VYWNSEKQRFCCWLCNAKVLSWPERYDHQVNDTIVSHLNDQHPGELMLKQLGDD